MSVVLVILHSIIATSKRDVSKDYEKNWIAKHDRAVEWVPGGADSEDGRGIPYRSGGTERYNSQKLPLLQQRSARFVKKGFSGRKQRFQCMACRKKFIYDAGKITSYSHQSEDKWAVFIEDTLSLKTLDQCVEHISVCHTTVFFMPRSYLSFWKKRHRMICWETWLKWMKPTSWKHKRHPCNREKAQKTQRNRNKTNPFQRVNVHLRCCWQG